MKDISLCFPETLIDAYASLRSPDFRRILLSYATATVAREAQIVVVGWQVYARTGDPLTLGLIGLAEALPFIGVALYAGHVADRMTRRTIAIAGRSASSCRPSRCCSSRSETSAPSGRSTS
jgi:hypothetical protein